MKCGKEADQKYTYKKQAKAEEEKNEDGSGHVLVYADVLEISLSQYCHELLCDLFRLDPKLLKQGRLIIVIYRPSSAPILALIGRRGGL